MTKPYWS